jgi:hypothetical protein
MDSVFRGQDQLGIGDAANLFHMQTNLRIGCVMLRHYLEEREGNIALALSDYYKNNIWSDGKENASVEFGNRIAMTMRRWE